MHNQTNATQFITDAFALDNAEFEQAFAAFADAKGLVGEERQAEREIYLLMAADDLDCTIECLKNGGV
jgi:hypothetical protein